MRAIMVMFDSLNRRFLPPYGCDWIQAPNFERLARRSVVFDNSFVGSMPCMPARRELHTGRYNFLHRSWGPLEPFDDSMPQILKDNGVYTHLVSDHYHYWEDGGCTYHTRYNSWEASRGQEGDPWKGHAQAPAVPEHVGQVRRHDLVNRPYMDTIEKSPQAKTFAGGLEFIRTNAGADNWFLQIETFDPHEPFFTYEEFTRRYPFDPDAMHYDWPCYGEDTCTPEQIQHLRYQYASLVSMCDASLGRVLDAMDSFDMWDDTMLIVNTDHGFMLGEHGFNGKGVMHWYNELANTPLLIWDPRSKAHNQRRSSLVQTIDLAPTLLSYFGCEIPADMQGKDLAATVASDKPIRTAGLFGTHGGHVNCTDGRYVYMRAPVAENQPLYEYTYMPCTMRSMFSVEDLRQAELSPSFTFTKGCRLLKIPGQGWWNGTEALQKTVLFDLQNDPDQNEPIEDASLEKRMIECLTELLRESDAPAEQYRRLGLRG